MEAYIAAILNSIKDDQDIKQVPPSCIFLIGLRKRAENWMSSEHLKKRPEHLQQRKWV